MTRQKVEDWLDGDNRILLEGWARNGLTDHQLATNIGIAPSTLYEWKKKNKEFSDILKRNKDVVDTLVENALLKAALDGNITAMIFWLKNRKHTVWRDKREEVYDQEDSGGIIMMPEVKDDK